ncbi:MAG TPA: alcohol dehydrogenase catalytic domain-containing protein [Verrucomicrobiae bacterium]|nr:alcohol dehydrogenase catalytic domain-containing protein [Verrucomicrobiae bacterium]
MFDIPKTMRAVVYRGVNDLRLETVPVPRIGKNEILVKVAVCGVCPTDIKKIRYGTVPPPRIFGHETAGTIVKIGDGVSRNGGRALALGDRVALHHHVPCLKCHYCRHRAFAQCETYKRTGITAGFNPAGGGYAEYVRVMDFCLPGVVKIPARNSFEEGAMLEPVNTVLKAVRRLNILRGDNVLVAGQGPIGLMFTRLLKLQGINVLATDLLDSRLKLAKKLGAKWILNMSSSGHESASIDSSSALRVPHSAFPLDAAIIAVPSDAAIQQAMQLVRGGGQILLFAHTKRNSGGSNGHQSAHSQSQSRLTSAAAIKKSGGQPSIFNLDFSSICVDEKDLIGSYSSDFTLQREVARLVFSRQLDMRPLITHRFPLDQTADAIALAARPAENSLKIIVKVAP